MNATLPSIRPDALAWSWRSSSKLDPPSSTPLTPPMSTTFVSRNYTSGGRPSSSKKMVDVREQPSSPMVLPPIAHLDRHIYNLPPLTPPEDNPYPQSSPPHSSRIALPKIAAKTPDMELFQVKPQPISMTEYNAEPMQNHAAHSQLPPHLPPTTYLEPPPQANPLESSPTSMDASEPPGVTPHTSAAAASTIETLALAPAPPPYLVDWLDFTRTRSAHFVAEKTCEMICYLWFQIPLHARASLAVDEDVGSLTKAKGVSSVTTLQLVATAGFVTFMQKLLETTQVSQSVIVLSLHYIHRLKEKNVYMPAQPGSEFRIAVAGLMMANKFLDDNTYTNKTWSEVSGISLDEINCMEREFLTGVDFNLYVDKTTYASWLNLLKGLVIAKERDARRLLRGGMRGASSARRGMRGERDGKYWHPHHPQHVNHVHSLRHRISSTGLSNKTHATPAAANAAVAIPDLFGRRQSATTVSNEAVYSFRHRARSTSPRAFTFSSTSRFGASGYASTQPEQPHQTYLVTEARREQQQQEQAAYTQQYFQPLPVSSTYAYPSSSTPSLNIPHVSSETTAVKRSAADAFSSPPPSYIPPVEQSRKPTSMYAGLQGLQIPEFASTTSSISGALTGRSSNNPSPLDGLGGFERMSLAEREGREREQQWREMDEQRRLKRAKAEPASVSTQTVVPQTLMAAYSLDEAKKMALPKNLFFYTLASSPNADEKERERARLRQPHDETTAGSEADTELYFEPRARKTKLRYQAAQPIKYGYNYADLNAVVTKGAPLYSYSQSSTARAMTSDQSRNYPMSTTIPASLTAHTRPVSPTPAVAPGGYVQSYSQRLSHATPSQKHHHSSAALFTSCAQPPHAAVTEQTSPTMPLPVGATPGSGVIIPGALPHFRDDVWAKPPLPAQNQDQAHAPVSENARVQAEWYEGQQQKEDQLMGYSESPLAQTTVHATDALSYGHQYASGNNATRPGSVVSSPYYQQQQHQPTQRRISQDVPSAPFANAGPPGVGAQFYATPEVHQVQMQMPAGYNNTYSTYGSTSITGNPAYPSTTTESGAVAANQVFSASRLVPLPSVSNTYVYGAHSTNNSPYHSASSGFYKYGDYGQPNSSSYGKY